MTTTDLGRAAASGFVAPLMSTKLHRPDVRTDVIERPDLLARLSATEARLTLIAAPPGWGKTTLLASWQRADRGRRFAWVSLDASDADPARFWAYVSASVAQAAGTADPVGAVLARPGVDMDTEVLPVLVNAWAGLGSRVLLVLDDYHVIDAPAVHAAMSRLVEALPRQVRIAIASRRDPELPLGRWRVRGQLQEVRVDALAFTASETGRLLNGALGLSLAPAQISRLHERTEGWAAALYLAALSLRGRAADDRQLPDLTGDHRHLVDYLVAEVLAVQPPEVRRFLLQTSVVRRLCGDLCDAVTGRPQSFGVLESIERGGLPIVALDLQRRWYRYHHLFAELLRRELERAEPEIVPELHRRAARWYLGEGMIPDAIEHSLAAGAAADRDAAAELVAAHWVEYFNRGLHATIDTWLAALPQEAWLSHPELVLSRVWIAMDTGHLEEVERWVAAAEASGAASRHVLGLLRSLHRFKSGDVAGSFAVLEAAGPAESTVGPFYQAVGSCLRGIEAFWAGRPAEEALSAAARLTRADNNDLGELYAVGYLAMLAARDGDRERAARLLRRSDALAKGDAGVHFVAMASHLARALFLEQCSDLQAASEAASVALRVSRGGAGAVEVVAVLATVGRIRAGVGDTAGARQALNEALRRAAGCADVGIAGDWLASLSRRLPAWVPPGQVRPGDELSERELEVLRMLPAQLSVRGLSEAMFVSPNTVKTHLRNIFRKLDVTSRDAAVDVGRSNGLL